MTDWPRYDRTRTYRWNYERAPGVRPVVEPEMPGNWTFCGLPVNSPLGIAAGPLLNGKWLLYYASLGFDVLTYKTVRSGARECYPLPNLQPVDTRCLTGGEAGLPAIPDMRGSWAVSFGMPSALPDVWRRDVEATRRRLPAGKRLSVSVVGTVQLDWSIEQLAEDYALCAKWAVESGADGVETNFSCPNVASCDGQLYQIPAAAGLVARIVRAAIGSTPYVIKIGHVPGPPQAAALLDAVAPWCDALAMTNCIAATVHAPDGPPLFDNQPRGIGGRAIREASLRQVGIFRELIQEKGLSTKLIGVGGIETAANVQGYLAAGAECVHLATAAMVNPLAGIEIRRDWPG